VKAKKHVIRKLKNIQALTPLLVVGVLVAAGAIIYNFNAHAATGGFSFTVNNSSVKVGDTVKVAVYEDSGTNCANVVQVDINYPANLLSYTSFDGTGSKFDSDAAAKSSNGQISVARFTVRKECGSGATATSGVSGKQLVGTFAFTAIAQGQASLSLQDSSIAVSAGDNRTDVAPGTASTTVAIASAGSTNPNPTPTPPSPTPSRPPVRPSLQVKVPNSDVPISLNDNGSVQITDPVDFNPLPIQPDGVNRVEYFLDGKLMATVKTPPYTYHLDTRNLLNGTYTLMTKTYYENGQTKTASQKIIVKNPFGLTQIKLWLAKYAWLVILLLLVVGGVIAAWLIHRKGNGSANYYGDKTLNNTSDYMVSGSNVVTPDSSDAAQPQVYQPNGSQTKK
jgi:hypothetical protein